MGDGGRPEEEDAVVGAVKLGAAVKVGLVVAEHLALLRLLALRKIVMKNQQWLQLYSFHF